ncbi:MAG: DUF6600 domain-containing protein [Bauldia sp.]
MQRLQIIRPAAIALALGLAPSFTPGLAALQYAYAQGASASISIFFNDLQPYGSWVQHSRYNYVWVPEVIDADWAPYTNGHWEFVEGYGWYFQSDEPFAAVVYHYGRWAYDAGIGWFWVPGTVWAPAWVSWRQSDDFVGWAPLPPEGNGFAIGFSISTATIPEASWHFVPAPRFLDRDLRPQIIFVRDRPEIYRQSNRIGSVRVQNNIVINNVLNINFIENKTNRRVEVRRPERVGDVNQSRSTGDGNTIKVVTGQLAVPRNERPQQTVTLNDYRERRGPNGVNVRRDGNAGPGGENRPAGDGNAPGNAANNPRVPPDRADTDRPGNTAGRPDGNTANNQPDRNGARPGQQLGNGPAADNPSNPRCADTAFARENSRICGPAAANSERDQPGRDNRNDGQRNAAQPPNGQPSPANNRANGNAAGGNEGDRDNGRANTNSRNPSPALQGNANPNGNAGGALPDNRRQDDGATRRTPGPGVQGNVTPPAGRAGNGRDAGESPAVDRNATGAIAAPRQPAAPPAGDRNDNGARPPAQGNNAAAANANSNRRGQTCADPEFARANAAACARSEPDQGGDRDRRR